MMKEIFVKSFVKPFYKAFLGLFLLIFILFGITGKADVHLMLGHQIIQSSYALLALILVFSLYSALHWNFQQKQLKESNYGLFHQLGLLNPTYFYTQQFYIWLSNHTILILYAVFLSILSIDSERWSILPAIWGMLAVLYFIYSSLIFYQLRHPLTEIKVKAKRIKKKKAVKTHYYFWLLSHLKDNRPLLILASKFISILFLLLFLGTYQTGVYDNRWLQFGILCISLANYPILMEKRYFETSKLSYFLNMPIPFFEKLKKHSLEILIIILPEIFFIIYQDFTSEVDFHSLQLIILLIALNLGLFGLCNSVSESSKMTRNTFISFFLLFFGILYNLPWIILSIPAIVLFLISIKSQYKN